MCQTSEQRGGRSDARCAHVLAKLNRSLWLAAARTQSLHRAQKVLLHSIESQPKINWWAYRASRSEGSIGFIGWPSIISRTFNNELSGSNKAVLKLRVAAAHNGRLIQWKVLCVILHDGCLCGFLVIPCAFVKRSKLLLWR